VPRHVTEQTIADAKAKLKALREAGYVLGDINFMVTPAGEFLLIDPGGLRKATGPPAIDIARMQGDVEKRLRAAMATRERATILPPPPR
jgi:hypothetical protein